MSRFDEQYLDLCDKILREGERVVNYKDKTDTARSQNGFFCRNGTYFPGLVIQYIRTKYG